MPQLLDAVVASAAALLLFIFLLAAL